MTDRGGGSFPVIVTDLDGSLLDHHNYQYEPARALLTALKQAGIPVIPCTSKTYAEVEVFRNQIESSDPCVVENGAAIVLPDALFDPMPPSAVQKHGNLCLEFAQPRSHWLNLLAGMQETFGDQFESFHQAGIEGIMDMTGLDRVSAGLANQRDYSEPVRWRGSDEQKMQFIAQLQQQGANVLQGGRFLAVGGDCDKGKALSHLQGLYKAQFPNQRVVTLAIGDSGNDVAMLDAADAALIIRSPVHVPPQLHRSDAEVSKQTGPDGWRDGVLHWLNQLDIQLNHLPM